MTGGKGEGRKEIGRVLAKDARPIESSHRRQFYRLPVRLSTGRNPMSDRNGHARNGHAEDFPLPLRPELTDELLRTERTERKREQRKQRKQNTSQSEPFAQRNGATQRRAARRAQPGAIYDEDVMQDVFDRACSRPLPKVAGKFLSSGMKRLVALCRELQYAARELDEDRFYLSCRDVARLIGLESPQRGARWLKKLCHTKVIKCVEPYRGGKKANRYKYLGD